MMHQLHLLLAHGILGQFLHIQPNRVIPSGRPKVAIIGAGASGSAAAYFLQDSGLDVQVFESSDRIGGRARVESFQVEICTESACYLDTTLVELGASIFAKANRQLMKVMADFGLECNSGDSKELHASVGIWDGKHWAYLEPPNEKDSNFQKWFGSWISKARFLWTYGLYSPYETNKLAATLAKSLDRIYQWLDDGYSFAFVRKGIHELDFDESVGTSCKDWLSAKGISSSFISEFIGGFNRVTYLQEVESTHAFACLVSVFSGLDETYSIKGGNNQMFEKMLMKSKVHLNTSVRSIARNDGYLIEFENSAPKKFDYVVVAAPLENSRIEFRNLELDIPKLPYVKLYGHIS